MAPWDFNMNTMIGQNKVQTSNALKKESALLSKGLESLFQAVSAVDSDRCSMAPTCSTYCLQAIEKHGIFLGGLMTIDRLLHELDEMDVASLVLVGGEYRYHDPVWGNDFWWFSEDRLDK